MVPPNTPLPKVGVEGCRVGSCQREQGIGVPPRQTSSGPHRCFGETWALSWAMLALDQALRAGPFSQTNRVIVICPCAPPSSVNAFTSLNICFCWLCLLESALTDLIFP